MKTCSKGDRTKPVAEFYADKRRNDRLKSHCKECHNKGCRNAQIRNPHYKEHRRLYMRNRRANQTSEERLAEKDAYRKWRRNTPAREALRCARRRARKVNAPQGDPQLLEAYAEVLQGDPCSFCGAQMEQLDHIQALDDRGSHDWTNLTAACRKCNASKNATPLLLWIL